MDRRQPVVQLQPGGPQRRAPVVGEGAAHRQAVGPGGLGLGVGPTFEGALDRADPPHLFLELLLGVPVRLVNRLGRFSEIMKLAELVGHPGQGRFHGVADRNLTVGDHAADRHRQRGLDFPQQGGQILLGGREEGPCQEKLPGEDIPHDPQHLVAHVRLQPVERQDDRRLLDQPLSEPGPIREPHGDQFLVAVHQVGDRPLADCQPTGHEFPMDLRDTARVSRATGADEGNHSEPKLGVRQNERAFRLRPVGPAVPLTSAVGTGPDLQGAGNESGEGGDGAVVRVGNPEGTTTDPAVVTAVTRLPDGSAMQP